MDNKTRERKSKNKKLVRAKKLTGIKQEKDRSKNVVQLRGRISGERREKSLPTGDTVVEFRLIVKRDDQGFDTFDIGVRKAGLRKLAKSMHEQEWVEIAGVIRRRFWNSPSGLASRWHVEAREMARI